MVRTLSRLPRLSPFTSLKLDLSTGRVEFLKMDITNNTYLFD